MKRYLTAIFLAVFLLGAVSLSFAEDSKIGYISLSRVFEGYTKVKDSNDQLEGQKKEARDMIEKMRKLQEGLDTLSTEGKEERKKQILDSQNVIKQKTVEIRKEEDRILRDVLGDIEKASAQLRKKNKLDYILDDRLVIDGPKEMDLTDEVLKILNKEYKK